MAEGSTFLGMPIYAILDQACTPLHHFGDNVGIFLVGSSLTRPDYRDIDIRMIMQDEAFCEMFPRASLKSGAFSLNPTWRFIVAGIAQHLKCVTGGLNIDFQIQPISHSKRYGKKPRHPLGIQIIEYHEPADEECED